MYFILLIYKELTNQSLYLLMAEMNDLFGHTFLDKIIKSQREKLNFRGKNYRKNQRRQKILEMEGIQRLRSLGEANCEINGKVSSYKASTPDVLCHMYMYGNYIFITLQKNI